MKKKSLLQSMDSQPTVSMKSLRQLAEEKLREKIIEDKESWKVLSADDVKQMLYDLELQQIQLELQNAEIESLRQRLDAFQHTTSGQVHHQRLAESILTTKTELLEVTGQLAKVGGWEFDLLRNSLYWTAETYRIHELEEHVEPSLAQAIHFYEPSAQPIIQEAVKEGIEQGKSWRLELPLITAKGSAIWVLAQGFAVVENGKTIKLIGAFQDITERKNSEAERLKLESQLRESQKLEAIGTLAGGIAHDFNNILSVILSNAELGRLDVRSGNAAGTERCFEEIRKAGERARGLVQQIISFSRRQPTMLKLTDLAPIIEESAQLLRSALPARVKIEVHIEEHLPPVLADANLMEQVIVNLATNSMQAMLGRPGKIDIWLDAISNEEGSEFAGESVAPIHPKRLGSKVRLMVCDSGSGMNAATLERIFEPFFTTKDVGQGTGLGLAVVHGIVRSHEGEISVESRPGVGTTFTICIPIAATSADVSDNIPVSDSIAAEKLESTSKPHLLLIDDDEAVLSSLKYLLERFGYLVSDYTDQREALDAFCVDPSEFELVLIDYNMPGMSGLDVAREVRRTRNDLPIAITSGFIDNELRSLSEAIGVQELIPKPCTAAELISIVQRLL